MTNQQAVFESHVYLCKPQYKSTVWKHREGKGSRERQGLMNYELVE